jgi:hypothetical protein
VYGFLFPFESAANLDLCHDDNKRVGWSLPDGHFFFKNKTKKLQLSNIGKKNCPSKCLKSNSLTENAPDELSFCGFLLHSQYP